MFYVKPDGSYGRATHLPEDAIQVSEDVYNLLHENQGLVGIEVHGSVVYVRPVLSKYKEAVEAKLRQMMLRLKPDMTKLYEQHLELLYGSLPRTEAKAGERNLTNAVSEWTHAKTYFESLLLRLGDCNDFHEADDILTLGEQYERHRNKTKSAS